jgi:hypothetical protein
MPRASSVITLVLLGSALALIGWSCFNDMQDESSDSPRSSHATHCSHLWFWGAGRAFFGGPGSSGSSPAPASGTVRGGFGGSAVTSAGG